MKQYVKYTGSSGYREIDLSHGVTTLALMSLMEFVNSVGWEVKDQLTSYVDLYYMNPTYKGGSMYRPYTCYRGSDVIGYYDPDFGGLTYYGGYRLRTATYNGYYVEMDIYDHPVYRFSIDTIFGGSAPTYPYKLGGYTQWNCFANPYQLIMVAYGTPSSGDLSGYSKGFLLSLPYLPSTDPDKLEIKSRVDYCGVVCGGLGTSSYVAGDITLHDNNSTSRIRLDFDTNDSYSPVFDPYIPSDSGLQFPVMRTLQDLMMVNDAPIINPAFISLPSDPSNLNSLSKVVGNLWDAFVVTQYIPRGTEITLDGKIWQCIISQGESTLRQTPGSIFVLKEE